MTSIWETYTKERSPFPLLALFLFVSLKTAIEVERHCAVATCRALGFFSHVAGLGLLFYYLTSVSVSV